MISLQNTERGDDMARTFFWLALTFSYSFCSTELFAIPPSGTTWAMVPGLSDEFDTLHANPTGDGLDTNKWWDFHPNWDGRLPSQFSPNNSWVEDGKLKLRSTPLISSMDQVNDPFNDHWVDSAIITSRAEAQPGDYLEASIKTAGLSMTSSWWFRQGSKSEIDVLENIGLPAAPGLTHRESEMSYNTHFYDPGPNEARGGNAQMIDEFGQPLLSRENFITYGMWWKNPTEIRMYYNDIEVATITPAGLIDEGLNMFFDMEVFHWVGFPTLESLNDPSRNTMEVDWVRGYRPVENSSPTNLVDNPGFEVSHPAQPSRPDFWVDCGNYDCGASLPFEMRSDEDARSGNWSLKVDNSRATSFGQFREIRSRDNVYSVLPGDTVQHQVWLKLTEAWEGTNDTFALGLRLNGDASQPRTGAGQVVASDGTVLAAFEDVSTIPRELTINDLFGGDYLGEWVKIEYELEIPETDGNGAPVQYITSLAFINNKTTGETGEGVLFLDDFSLEVLNDSTGDHDLDGDVDGADFLAWQRNESPNGVDIIDLLRWQGDYAGAVETLANASIVPEPGSLAVLFVAAATAMQRRCRLLLVE